MAKFSLDNLRNLINKYITKYKMVKSKVIKVNRNNDKIIFLFNDDNLLVKCPLCDNEFHVKDMTNHENHITSVYKNQTPSRVKLNVTCPKCNCSFEKYYKITSTVVTKLIDISDSSQKEIELL